MLNQDGLKHVGHIVTDNNKYGGRFMRRKVPHFEEYGGTFVI